MTLPKLSDVRLMDFTPTVTWSRGEALGHPSHGIPVITGNYAICGNTIANANVDGETMIICTPVSIEGEPFIHLAFGSLEHRVAHNVSIAGLELIVTNLTTILELAKLDQPGEDECPSRRTK